jgi:hypothetical protein
VELGLIVAVALLVLLGGAAGLIARQRMIPWNLPALRAMETNTLTTRPRQSDPRVESAESPEGELGNGRITPHRHEPPLAVAVVQPTLNDERPRAREVAPFDAVPPFAVKLDERLDRLEARFDELARAIAQQRLTASAELDRAASELAARVAAEDARRDAALERLRGDLLAAVIAATGERERVAGDRHVEVCAELYANLARLEAALAAVTNPILLPGEPYAPPEEFIPEALVWENWNEVGERAFALADAFSARRLHLSEQTRADVGMFVTALRTRLTGSVYPNLQVQGQGRRAQETVLRTALAEIATDLARMRATLEREVREVSSARGMRRREASD